MADSLIFSKIDADRILARAAEIEGAEDTRPLTLDELRSIAEEAGFGSHAVERAIVEAQQAVPAEVRSSTVQKSGWVITHLTTVRTIPIKVSSEHLMRAVRLLQPYREGLPNVDLGEDRITWRDRKGLRFMVTSAGGITEIRVFVAKFLIRRGHWMEWVKAAADRLEALVFLVAARELAGTRDLGARPPESNSSADGPQRSLTSGEPTETR